MGGRSSNSAYEYTLKSDNLADLRNWTTKLADRLKQETAAHRRRQRRSSDNGVESYVDVDRDSAARLGLTRPRHRQRALQRLRPAPGGHHLRRAQPVLGDHGVGAELPCSGPTALKDVYLPASHRRGQRADGGNHRSANPGQRGASTGAPPVATAASTMVPLSAVAKFSERATPTSIAHAGRRAGQHHLLQPGRRRAAQRGAAAIEQAEADIAMPINVRGAFPGTARRLPADRGPAAVADPGGAGGHLHRAGHPVREPDPPGDRAVDPAFGRRRRGARAAAVPHGVLHHRADRRVPPDRHRQEERHPDHRLRAGGRARARPDGRARRCAKPACCASARS